MNEDLYEKALIESIMRNHPSLLDPRMFMLAAIDYEKNGLRGWLGFSLALSVFICAALFALLWYFVG